MANAFLYSEVSDKIRRNLETGITVLLDDPAPAVRFALANALANSPQAPKHAVLALAGDQTGIAEIVAGRSPVLSDSELVEMVGAMSEPLQLAIAARPAVSAGVSAAITELGTEAACSRLLDNSQADLAKSSLERLAERFAGHPEIRTALLDREDLPALVRHTLVRGVSDDLGNLVRIRDWLDGDRTEAMLKEAGDQATVSIASHSPEGELIALAEHLRVTEQMTSTLLLRTLCSGNLDFFAAALSVLAGMPIKRIKAIVVDHKITAFGAVYRRAGLPEQAFEAFTAAIQTCRHYNGEIVEPAMRYRFTRHLVDDVVARYEEIADGEISELTAMLRRFAADATRAAAREFVETEIKAA